MKDMYNEVAKSAAKFAWQAISTVLPQVGIWYAADKTGNVADWALGNKKPAANAEPRKSFLSRLNPLSAIKSLNPVSLVSFAAKPFSSVKKALSWFLFEEIAYEMNDKIRAPLQRVAPIAEKFLTPIAEKVTTPVVNFLQDNGFMQLPKPDMVCSKMVCESIPAPALETMKEVSRQAGFLPETGNIVSRAWNFVTQPLVDFSGSAAKAAVQNPIPMENVFAGPVKEAARIVIEQAGPTPLPQGYLAITEHYAEPAGRYVAETMSETYHTLTNAAQRVSNVHDAIDKSIDLVADALGIHRGWIIAAGVGSAAIVVGSGYALLNHGWNRNTAVANSNASSQANGGNASNSVQFIVQLPTPQGTPNNGQALLPPPVNEVPKSQSPNL